MIALQKLIMTLKINHIHMKKQHNIPKSFIPKPQHHKIMKYHKTTWGMSILASKEFNESIWHTNKYTTGEPSGVPADDVTNYPNDNGHPYGNNV